MTSLPLLLLACFDRKFVDEVVHGVAAMTLDPTEFDVAAIANELDEGFPEIAVCHRLFL